MKICMVLQNLFPPIDVRPYKEAKTLIRHGHEVTLVCMRGGGQKEQDNVEGIKIHRLSTMPLPHFTFLNFALPVALKMFRKTGFGAYHIHNPPDSLVFPALFQKIRNRAKIVLDIHDPVIPGMMQSPEDYKWITFSSARFWEKTALNYSDRIIVVSEGSEERLLSFDVPPEKITVIKNYVDTGTFDKKNASPDEIRRRFGLNDDKKKIILCVGTISPIRGIDVLIRAFAKLKNHHKDLTLMIVGNAGRYQERLKEIIKEEGIEGDSLILPWQPYRDMPDLIAASDICVLPRKYSLHTAITGNPNTLFQYMAMQKPIVATDLLSINSFVDDDCAVLAEADSVDSLSEGLHKVLDNPGLAGQISKNAYKLAMEKYNWEVESKKLLKLYNGLER